MMNDSGIKIEVIKLQDSVQDDPKPIKQLEPIKQPEPIKQLESFKTVSMVKPVNIKPDISFNDLSFQMESKVKPIEQSLQNSDLSRIHSIRKIEQPIRKKPIKVSFNTPEPNIQKKYPVIPIQKREPLPQIVKPKPVFNQSMRSFNQPTRSFNQSIQQGKPLPPVKINKVSESQKIKRILDKESDGYKTGYLPSMQQKGNIKLPKKPISLSKFQALLGIKTEVKGLRNG